MNAQTIARAAAIGCGATAVMDIVGEVVRRTRGVPPLDLRLVGRWIGHFKDGEFVHEAIFRSEPVRGEYEIGLAAHYGIGAGFAVAFAATRPGWVERPTFVPALTFGLLTTSAPWLIMQPAFGIGVAASKTPDPTVARLRSLRAHTIYGVGLYLSAVALRPLPTFLRRIRF